MYGLRKLLPEWAPQSGVMLTWPHRHSDWRPWLDQVEPVFVEIARHISCHEKVLISCWDESHREHIALLLEDARVGRCRIRLYITPSNDTWARDHGPITVLEDDAPLLLDFTFNGWGRKFPSDLDDRLTRRLHTQGAFHSTPRTRIDFVLEGGSIDCDGEGSVLTTERCLLSPNRNQGANRERITAFLQEVLGIQRILWLKAGYLEGDDTDGHVDMLARFCDARTIAHTACDDSHDIHYPELKRMEEELAILRTMDGKPYRLVPLPLPSAKYAEKRRRLPASYANFLIINGAVLVPMYDDPADDVAMARLRGSFPGREIIGVPSLPLIRQQGSLHCVTMQLPQGVL